MFIAQKPTQKAKENKEMSKYVPKKKNKVNLQKLVLMKQNYMVMIHLAENSK